MPGGTRNKVFVSYSHKDKKFFEEFRTMLAPALQRGVIEVWDDTKIVPGAQWRSEIRQALASAKVAVLLVSPNFLASEFIANHELPPLLQAAQEEGVTVFWIYLSSCLYKQSEISDYQAAHDITKSLDQFTKPERLAILSTVCTTLVNLVRNAEEASQQAHACASAQRSATSSPLSTPPVSKRQKRVAQTDGETRRPTAAEVYRRAIRLLADEQYDEALAAFDDTLELDPTLAVAFYNRGLTHYLRRDADEVAIADFNRAWELGFDDVLLYRNRANAFSRQGDVARALADYARAIELEPGNPLAYLNRGEVYQNTLQKDLAVADYQTVLQLVCEPYYHDMARQRLLALGVNVASPK